MINYQIECLEKIKSHGHYRESAIFMVINLYYSNIVTFYKTMFNFYLPFHCHHHSLILIFFILLLYINIFTCATIFYHFHYHHTVQLIHYLSKRNKKSQSQVFPPRLASQAFPVYLRIFHLFSTPLSSFTSISLYFLKKGNVFPYITLV